MTIRPSVPGGGESTFAGAGRRAFRIRDDQTQSANSTRDENRGGSRAEDARTKPFHEQSSGVADRRTQGDSKAVKGGNGSERSQFPFSIRIRNPYNNNGLRNQNPSLRGGGRRERSQLPPRSFGEPGKPCRRGGPQRKPARTKPTPAAEGEGGLGAVGGFCAIEPKSPPTCAFAGTGRIA